MKKKTIDTLVSDVYDVLKNVIDGDSHDVSEEAVEHLGQNIAGSVKRALTARTGSRKDKVLYMSEVGKPCRRQIWYGLRDETPREKLLPHTIIKFLYGDILEDLLLFFAEEAGHTVEDQQKVCEVEYPNGWRVRGRLDAKIDGRVVDAKSASTFAFKKFRENRVHEDDPFGYIEQLNHYCEAEGVQIGEPMSFFAIDKQNGNLVLDTYTYVGSGRESDRLELVEQMEADDPPARGFDPVPEGKSGNLKLGLNCSYCPFKQECWKDANDGKGIRAFAYSHKPVFLVKVEKEPRVPEIPLEKL